MNKSNRFSPEVRERAVRMVQEHRGEYPSLWAAIESIAPKIGCVPQTLHEWVRKHEIDSGMREGITSEERDRIEKEQDLHAQQYSVQSLQSSISQSEKRLAQIQSDYRQKLEAERVATYAEYQKLEQEWAKQSHRNSLLELKAPQAGIVKDLATHTPGTVVSPGTVLMTLVPNNEALLAEVWLKNADAGFVHAGQEVKVKLLAYPFQKYGMVDGKVMQVSADASDSNSNSRPSFENTEQPDASQLSYRTLIKLDRQNLQAEDETLMLSPGMQVAAEIKLADQTVMEYLLSPVRKAFHEAGRER